VGAGVLGAVRLVIAHEEHGRGRQLGRLRAWPHAAVASWLTGGLALLVVFAALAGAVAAAAALTILACVVAFRGLTDCAVATAAVADLFRHTAYLELQRAPAQAPEPAASTEQAA
jgi:hypothetical protein